MGYEERIGPSSLILGLPGAKAIMDMINAVRDAGFKAIEICPAQFCNIDPAYDPMYLDTVFNKVDRERLKTMLESFHLITVHGSSSWVTSIDECVTKETWKPYLGLMRFAHDIGADIVSFHPIQRKAGTFLSDEEMAKYNVMFGRTAAEYARAWDLFAAFENMPGTNAWSHVNSITKIIDRVNSRRFGLLFDISHAALQIGDPLKDLNRTLQHLIAESLDKIVQVHIHGVCKTISPQQRSIWKDHRPLDDNNIINYEAIVNLLKNNRFHGPMIFEIYYDSVENDRATFHKNLESCLMTKHQLLEWMRHN